MISIGRASQISAFQQNLKVPKTRHEPKKICNTNKQEIGIFNITFRVPGDHKKRTGDNNTENFCQCVKKKIIYKRGEIKTDQEYNIKNALNHKLNLPKQSWAGPAYQIPDSTYNRSYGKFNSDHGLTTPSRSIR
jgi:hypothetical protein